MKDLKLILSIKWSEAKNSKVFEQKGDLLNLKAKRSQTQLSQAVPSWAESSWAEPSWAELS